MYQGVRNVSFLDNFANLLHELPSYNDTAIKFSGKMPLTLL